MNNQDYEQKKRECWEDFCNEHLFDPHNIITQGIFGYAFDRAYTLGKQAKDVKKPGCGQTIKGWAACDRDGMLRLHYDKPERTDGGYWQGGFKSSYLPTAVVLPIVWESAPIEVEVTIKQCFSSDVEEEDNPQARAWNALTPAMRTYCRNMRRTSHDGNVVDLLDRLFGPKCLPDGNFSNVDKIGKDCNADSSEPKPAEPRFKVEDEVVWDKRIIAYVDEILNDGYYIIYSRAGNQYTVHESDLEPYTEPEERNTNMTIEEINKAIIALQPNEGQVSDGYHTFHELYDFRRAYNAALVNTHAYPCIKSHRHSDGELCFGGGWFVVQMQLPTGQISNHYEDKHWDEFDCEERECADPWDGHTEKDVLERLRRCRNLSQSMSNCDKEFDNILKDGFRNERRLNIAVQLTCAMIPKYQDNGDGHGLSVLNEKDMIKCAYRLADSLISECEKGGSDGN